MNDVNNRIFREFTAFLNDAKKNSPRHYQGTQKIPGQPGCSHRSYVLLYAAASTIL